MNAIYDLIGRKAYDIKMKHVVPAVPVIDRNQYLLKMAKGKTILDIGATGPMHEALRNIAKKCHGIDITTSNREDHYAINIDKATELPEIPEVELVIAGELIEHLDNAGHFLDLLKRYLCPIILTTPNAFSSAGFRYMGHGIECVNPEHVAYYSWWTLSTLVRKHGYKLIEWYWYNGMPLTAEGIIFLMEAQNGTS